MKIDAFHYVQLGTAYRSVLTLPCPLQLLQIIPSCLPPPFPTLCWGLGSGPLRTDDICAPPRGLQPVPDEEVIDLYGGTQHIPLYQMSGFYGKVLTPSATPRAASSVISLWVLPPWQVVSTSQ